MAKLCPIESCKECLYFKPAPASVQLELPDYKGRCLHPDAPHWLWLVETAGMPDWCPLPDAPEEED